MSKPEDRPLFVMGVEDAQTLAQEILGRQLTEEELRTIQKDLEWCLTERAQDCITDTIRAMEEEEEIE